MDISSVFDISAAGMNLQRTRLEVSALNLANADTTRGPDGLPFTPLQVVVHASANTFEALLQASRDGASPSVPLPVPRCVRPAGLPVRCTIRVTPMRMLKAMCPTRISMR